MKPDIVRRYAHNPILTKAEIPYPVETGFLPCFFLCKPVTFLQFLGEVV